MKHLQKIHKKYLILGSLFLIVFVLGYLAGTVNDAGSASSEITEIREKGYEFTSPLLDYQSIQETSQGQLQSLKKELVDYVEGQKVAQNITHASVYFRELNNGPWLGLNEKEEFSPASLLKVPILIAILKKAEDNPGLLDQKVMNVPINDGTIQDIIPSNPLKEGLSYTVWELIEHMILYSDNRAKNLLILTFKDRDFDRVYKDLGISIPSIEQPEDFMSVRNYASFFRILYNASYLNNDMSNKALELLSRSEFKQGIVSGIPKEVKVSHKFGERMIGEVKQLHDCGIIYYKNNPTLLCIMTRGYEWDKLSRAIHAITQITNSSVSRDPSK